MAFNNLKKYVEERNRWQAIIGTAPMAWPLTQNDVDNLASHIDSELSPEHLCCDGELPMTEVRRKKRKLDGALADLQKYADQYSMTLPHMYCA